jgi:hypothetical protein
VESRETGSKGEMQERREGGRTEREEKVKRKEGG